MTELVEKVARAIMAERDGEEWDCPATEYDRQLATAAIEAMRPEIAEAYDLLAAHHCDLRMTARHVTRERIGAWLDRVKPILGEHRSKP